MQDAVSPRVAFPAGVWLYNHLCDVTWPQLKSVMEAKKTRLTGTGMCLPICRNMCIMLERVLQSDTGWWCMDFAIHPRILPAWYSV